MNNALEGEVLIRSEGDIVTARRTVRDAAVALGFGLTDVTRIVTAASELARNVFTYAGSGAMRWQRLSQGNPGLELVFEDHGPGMADIAKCLESGYSSTNSLGLGLSGAKRLMDEMTVDSHLGQGTTVVVRKWRGR
jgi:serine/threonine-protein kinase RsbT